MRVAIVGAGPRGLFAAERLLAHGCKGELEVCLFDPREPGIGAAYHPDQPPYLRLNVNSAVVAAAWPGTDLVASFDQWRAKRNEATPLDPFPARALVGEYLAWFWGWLRDHAADGITLTHRAATVDSVAPGPTSTGAWLVNGEPFDEVLLATGHESDWPGALCHRQGRVPVVERVYPVAEWLTEERIPAGSRVAIRGAALTFIDAVLALTEGRGGRFTGRWPGALTYHASGLEPAVIWPISRSGRWMDPKPQPGSDLAKAPAEILERGRATIAAASTAREALAQVREVAAELGATEPDLDTILTHAAVGEPATQALRRRLAAMAGNRPPDAAWALGHAWRGLYDALRARFEGVDSTVEFAPFARLATTLEPVAFGPPPVNAAKLIALIEAGIIDPGSLETASFDGSTPVGLPGEPDLVVDAVLPPPGVIEGSLTSRLVADGVLTRATDRRGVAVAADASCLDGQGRPVPGLACIGRATEDVVIGNDTLNRSMHAAVDGWATRLAGMVAP